MCDHSYQYMGLQYADGANPLPGSGAVRRYYAHVFYCDKCLDMRAERVDGYEHENSYCKPRDGAVGGDRKLIAPSHDRTYGHA